jgi:hypothetical protein
MKLMKNIKHRNSEVKVDTFRNDAKTRLFDILVCKCVFEECLCDMNRKSPSKKQAFLHDQRPLRLMAIGGVDKLASKKIAMKILRKAKDFRAVRSTKMQLKRWPGRPSSAVEARHLGDCDNDDGSRTFCWWQQHCWSDY